MIRTPESESKKAALLSFSEAGMGRAKIIAKTGLSPNAIDVLDSHKNAKGYSIFVTGDISGEPAYGIALVLYGSLDDGKMSSGVHGFMAPTEKFSALGGFSIVAAKWLYASASPNEDMKIEGSLAPQMATNRLALFLNNWIENYVIPMQGMSMQMQMQSIQQMQN